MQKVTTRRKWLRGAVAIGVGITGGINRVNAQANTVLKVNTFPGVTNFPIFAADHQRLFAKYGLASDLIYTPNSRVQRDGLAKGEYQILQTAADNQVAMGELDKANATTDAGGTNS